MSIYIWMTNEHGLPTQHKIALRISNSILFEAEHYVH